MTPKLVLAACLLFALCSYGADCGEADLELTDDPSLDIWCGAKLCDAWDSTGDVKRVGTWHDADFGVQLGSEGASLSQTIEREDEQFICAHISLLGHWTKASKLVVEFDWNADGTADWSKSLVANDWERWDDTVDADAWTQKFIVTVRREGSDDVQLAEIRVRKESGCTESSDELTWREAGEACYDDGSCSSGICTEASPDTGINHGTCAPCGDAGCLNE